MCFYTKLYQTIFCWQRYSQTANVLAPLSTPVLTVSFSHNLLDLNASAADLQDYVKPYSLSSLHARICPVLEGCGFFHCLIIELTLQNSNRASFIWQLCSWGQGMWEFILGELQRVKSREVLKNNHMCQGKLTLSINPRLQLYPRCASVLFPADNFQLIMLVILYTCIGSNPLNAQLTTDGRTPASDARF